MSWPTMTDGQERHVGPTSGTLQFAAARAGDDQHHQKSHRCGRPSSRSCHVFLCVSVFLPLPQPAQNTGRFMSHIGNSRPIQFLLFFYLVYCYLPFVVNPVGYAHCPREPTSCAWYIYIYIYIRDSETERRPPSLLRPAGEVWTRPFMPWLHELKESLGADQHACDEP